MKKQNNIIHNFADPVEERQIRHFACKEMGRQIHRYIKGMRGSKAQMLRFEDSLENLSLEEREKAIALYLDLNRKALKGLDMKMVLVRSVANYSDTFEYLVTLVNDKRKMVNYLNLLKETYIQYHQVIEKDGKFGIVDYQGNTILSPKYEFVRTCYVYVDDLRTMPIIAQLDGKLGLVLPDGKETLVTPFKYDALADSGATFVGQVDGDGYGSTDTDSFRDGKFVGLPLDDADTDSHASRIADWVATL